MISIQKIAPYPMSFLPNLFTPIFPSTNNTHQFVPVHQKNFVNQSGSYDISAFMTRLAKKVSKKMKKIGFNQQLRQCQHIIIKHLTFLLHTKYEKANLKEIITKLKYITSDEQVLIYIGF